MRPLWYVVLGVAICFLAILLWHHHRGRDVTSVKEMVEVRFDTLSYFDYLPSSVTHFDDPDSLSIYLFCDSVDGMWSAEVAGRDVELRSLVLREKIESRHTIDYLSPSWEVVMQGGFSGTTSWVGVGVERNVGRLKLSVGAGYDPFNRTPHVEGRVGVVLWRE